MQETNISDYRLKAWDTAKCWTNIWSLLWTEKNTTIVAQRAVSLFVDYSQTVIVVVIAIVLVIVDVDDEEGEGGREDE